MALFINYGIVICSLLILVLSFLITKIYITKRPIFNFQTNNISKPHMAVTASIAQLTYFIGFLFFFLAFFLFSFFNYRWQGILIIPLFLSFFAIATSFLLLFKSYNWELNYLKYRYFGICIATIGSIGQFVKIQCDLITARDVAFSLPEYLNLLLNFPFLIPLIVGNIMLVMSVKSEQI